MRADEQLRATEKKTDGPKAPLDKSAIVAADEHKRLEAAVRANEERYRSTLDGLTEGCQLIGFDWSYLYLNRMAAVHNRRPNDELIGRKMTEMWPGIEAAPVFAQLRRSMEERVALHQEIEFRFPDGSSGWFDVRSQPVPEGIFVLSIDVAERRQVDAARARLAAIVNSSNDAIIGKSLDGIITSWNPGAEKIFGYTEQEAVGKPILMLVPGERLDEERSILARISRGESVRHFETVRLHKDGRPISISVAISPIVDREGKIIGASKIARDITAAKKSQEALIESQSRFQQVVENLTEGLLIADLEGNVLHWNSAGLKMYGFASMEEGNRLRQQFTQIFELSTLDGVVLSSAEWPLARVLWGASLRDLELQLRRLDKEWRRIFSFSGSIVRYGNGRALVSITFTDVTERRLAERALRTSEARHRSTLDNIMEGCQLIGFDWRYLYLNDTAAVHNRRPNAELLGRTMMEMWPGIDRSAAFVPIRRAMEERVISEEENEFVFPDGSKGTFALRVQPVPEGILILSADTTLRRRAETSVRESQALYHALVEQMPAGVFRKDAEGRYVFVNAYFCTLRKTTADQFLGRLPRELPLSEARFFTQAADHHRRIMQTGESIEVVDEYHRADGKVLYFQVVKSPVLDSTGKIVGSQGVLLDITARKEAENALRTSEARVQSVLSALVEGVVFLNPGGEIEMANGAVEHVLGRSLRQLGSEAEGPRFLRGDGTPCPREEQPAFVALRTGQGVRNVELGVPLPDGELRWISVNAERVSDAAGTVLGAVASFFDITERKKSEVRMRHINAELEQRVVERTSQLAAANKELEAFSYSVSHDLRAPLRAVNGFAGIVLEDFGPQLPETGRKYLQRICDGGRQMGELIDDLLEFARLGRQAFSRRQVDMVALVNAVLKELSASMENRSVEIRVGDLPPVNGDASLLKQVWINLISNALKYSRRRTPATIEVGCRDDADEKIYFVRDNGTGFDMRYAQKLFGVFQRLHRPEEFEGTGVGLAIVQRIVHRHGGRVWAEAEEDRGATFYFTLVTKNSPS